MRVRVLALDAPRTSRTLKKRRRAPRRETTWSARRWGSRGTRSPPLRRRACPNSRNVHDRTTFQRESTPFERVLDAHGRVRAALEISQEVLATAPRGRVERRTTGIDAIQAARGLGHPSKSLFGAPRARNHVYAWELEGVIRATARSVRSKGRELPGFPFQASIPKLVAPGPRARTNGQASGCKNLVAKKTRRLVCSVFAIT